MSTVNRAGASHLKKRGGDADGYIPDIKPIILRRYVPNRIADLHR